MTSVYDFYLPDFISEIICLITFSKFFSFIYVTSKLSISSNHTKHPKKLVLYYTLFFFKILKVSYPTGQPAYLEEDDFSFARKILSHTKKSGFQSSHQLFILQVRPKLRSRL